MTREPLHFGRYDFAAVSAFVCYSVCSFSIPLMIVTMGKSLNFPLDGGGMAAGGLLHAVRSAAMMLSLLLCGFAASRFGKRPTMGGSMLMFGAGMFLCSFSTQYWMLLPCLMLVGFGEGICEGLATPFIQDLHPDSPERYVNIGHGFWSVGIIVAVASVAGLITLGVSWRFILGGVGLFSMLLSAAFLWKENPGRKYPESPERIDARDLLKKTKVILREPCFLLCCAAMFFGAGAEFGLTFWAAAYIELTFRTSAFVAGLGTGVIALGMFLGRTGFGYIARPGNLRKINLCAALATVPVTLALAFLEPGVLPGSATFVILFLLLFLAGIGIAPYWPTTQVYGVRNLPHCDSTLLYIYFSMLGIPGCGFFSWLMGAAGDRFGLKGTILVVPCCLLAFLGILLYERRHAGRRRKKRLEAGGRTGTSNP